MDAQYLSDNLGMKTNRGDDEEENANELVSQENTRHEATVVYK